MNDDRRRHPRESADRRRAERRAVPPWVYGLTALLILLAGMGLLAFIGL